MVGGRRSVKLCIITMDVLQGVLACLDYISAYWPVLSSLEVKKTFGTRAGVRKRVEKTSQTVDSLR